MAKRKKSKRKKIEKKGENLLENQWVRLALGLAVAIILIGVVLYLPLASQSSILERVYGQSTEDTVSINSGSSGLKEIDALPNNPGGLPGSGSCGSPTCTGGASCRGGCGGGCGG